VALRPSPCRTTRAPGHRRGRPLDPDPHSKRSPNYRVQRGRGSRSAGERGRSSDCHYPSCGWTAQSCRRRRPSPTSFSISHLWVRREVDDPDRRRALVDSDSSAVAFPREVGAFAAAACGRATTESRGLPSSSLVLDPYPCERGAGPRRRPGRAPRGAERAAPGISLVGVAPVDCRASTSTQGAGALRRTQRPAAD